MTASHVSPAFKKIGGLLTGHLAGTAGIIVINYRLSAIWGPLGRTASPFFAAPQVERHLCPAAKPCGSWY